MTPHVLPDPGGPWTHTNWWARTEAAKELGGSFRCLILRNLSMDSDDESLTKQVLNMVLENNAIKDTVFPYLIGWFAFNIVILMMLVYISVRLTLR
jgi:hypothetical protein